MNVTQSGNWTGILMMMSLVLKGRFTAEQGLLIKKVLANKWMMPWRYWVCCSWSNHPINARCNKTISGQ